MFLSINIAGGISSPITSKTQNNTMEINQFLILAGICLVAVISFLVIIAIIATEFRKKETINSKIVCPVCQSNNFTYSKDTLICDQCGCKYSIEDAKNNLKPKEITNNPQPSKKSHKNPIIFFCFIFISILIFLYFTLPLPKITSNGFTYILQNDGTYRIDSCNKNETFIEIPSEIRNRPVTEISSKAFENNTKVKTIILPESITSIGCAVFKNCSSLETLILPFIGGSPESHTHLSYLFSKSGSLTTAASEVPTSLENIYLLDSCTTITEEAFYKCESLKNIYIPSSVTSIKDGNTSFSIVVKPTFNSLPFYECSPELIIHYQNESENDNWGDYWNYINQYYSLRVNYGVKLKDDYTLSSASWYEKAEDLSPPKTIALSLNNFNTYFTVTSKIIPTDYSSNLLNPGYQQAKIEVTIQPIYTAYIYNNVQVTIAVTINFNELEKSLFSKEITPVNGKNSKIVQLDPAGKLTTNFTFYTARGVIENINEIQGTCQIINVYGELIPQ